MVDKQLQRTNQILLFEFIPKGTPPHLDGLDIPLFFKQLILVECDYYQYNH